MARAQKLDKDDKKWLDDVRPLIVPDEEKTYKGLKDKADRLEFQKIFWARRDPDLATPENEFQAQYVKAYAEADQYQVPGKLGVETDCGRIFILLGKPDEVQKDQVGANPAARSRDLDLPRPPGPDLHRRQGRDRVRRLHPASRGQARRAARPPGRGEGRPSRTSTTRSGRTATS